jgi:hypothetical protein
METLLLLLCDTLVLLCVLQWEGREPPFIGGEEGALWKMLSPHMEGTKLPPNRHQSALSLDVTGEPSWARRYLSIDQRWGCGRTTNEPKSAHLCWLPPMIIWTWPMMVFYAVEMFGLGFGLVLHLFWALFCMVVGLSPLGLCRSVFVLCSFAHF